MNKVLVIGGGFAGCCAASRLAEGGAEVLLVESASEIGGRVRKYGCKAGAKCNDCGVCLAGGLWAAIVKNPSVKVITSARVTDLRREACAYTAEIESPAGCIGVGGISSVLVSTGFDSMNEGRSAYLHLSGETGVLTGTELETVMRGRGRDGIFAAPPGRVAFVQCFGSRDGHERSNYCSRVCCSYSVRMTKAIKHYYPGCGVTFFYMELQNTANSDVWAELAAMGVRFLKCRPLEISGGRPVTVEYDAPALGRMSENFDVVVLSEGIHPSRENWKIAEICGLEQDKNGFLRAESAIGVHVAGTARRPMTIAETRHDAVTAAAAILSELCPNGSAAG
ncbi:MAG: NAD(P)-binding protein [Synergistaceae bacterium]|nr:NAD(P)-binding protein [Synergistaceae bacterium]